MAALSIYEFLKATKLFGKAAGSTRHNIFYSHQKEIMKRDNDNSNNPRQNAGIPQNDPSKAMNSKREVEDSNDAKIDQDFPGYPHYPAKEDIMDQRTGSHKVDMEMENLPGSRNASGVSQRFVRTQQNAAPRTNQEEEANDELGIRSGIDSDGDDDELDVLNSTDDEIGVPQNISDEDINTDLDVPGSELDDDSESIGEEDEENNYYSLGGDRHESQEEDPYSGPERGDQ